MRLVRQLAHHFAGLVHATRGAPCSFTHLLVFGDAFSFNAQTFRAIRHRLSAAARGFTGRSCTFTNQIGNRKLLVELASLAARSLLPLVEPVLVISHS